MGTPDTVVRWHRQGWRLVWRWRSRAGAGRPGLTLIECVPVDVAVESVRLPAAE
jgi:hypothetical protein